MTRRTKAQCLFATTDRDEAHRFLADVLDGPGGSAGGESAQYRAAMEAVEKATCHSAECREDPNAELPYQVWTGPQRLDKE